MNRQIGVGDSKYVIVFDPLLTGHVIQRMGSGRVRIFNGNQWETLSHARTVVRECCKGDDESQREMGKFDPPATQKPLNRWSPKVVYVTTSGISTTTQNFILSI